MRRRRAGSCWAAALFGVLTVGTAWVRSEQKSCSPFQDWDWDDGAGAGWCGQKHMELWQRSPAANASNRLDFQFRFSPG
jgi:hypothetical protein